MNIREKIYQFILFLATNQVLRLGIWLLYVFLLCFVSYYHEPWHDEGQAWLIARDDSFWHLITYTTHLEGHPPLWHLCLMPFAKLGIAFEIGLKSVNIFFCALAMWFLIIKSPLAWYWRFFLPFTYFFFYQYGVINRTYSLLMFAMMLAAYYYPSRRKRPLSLALALVLLSGSQAYGMMIACGIALAWFLDVCCSLKQDGNRLSLVNLWQARECKALLFLFIMAILWTLSMIPFANTAFANLETAKRGNFWQNMFYCVFVMPAQLFCETDVKDSMYDGSFTFFLVNLHKYLEMAQSYGAYAYVIVTENILKYLYAPVLQLSLGYVSYHLGLGLLFLLPEICFFVLASLVYINPHHVGILACFYVFMLWQIYVQPSKQQEELSGWLRKKFTTLGEYRLVQLLIYGIFVGMLAINLGWSYKDARVDIKVPYDTGRNIASFIKLNNMQNLRFWIPWRYAKNDNKIYMGSYNINPYFKNPFIENLNGGFTKYGFLEYKIWDKDAFENNLKILSQPDIYLDEVPLVKIFDKPRAYVPVHRFEYYQVRKSQVKSGTIVLYLRQDLLADYPQLHELTKDELNAPLKY